MIDVHQNAALSESFEGDRSRVIGNRCNNSSRGNKENHYHDCGLDMFLITIKFCQLLALNFSNNY